MPAGLTETAPRLIVGAVPDDGRRGRRVALFSMELTRRAVRRTGHGERPAGRAGGLPPSVSAAAGGRSRSRVSAWCTPGLPLDWTAEHARRPWRRRAGLLAGMAAGMRRPALLHLHAPPLVGDAAMASAPSSPPCHSCVATWWGAVRDGPLPAGPGLARRRHRRPGCSAPPAAIGTQCRARPTPMRRRLRADADVTVIPNGLHPSRLRCIQHGRRGVMTAGRLWDEAKGAADAGPRGPAGSCIRVRPGRRGARRGERGGDQTIMLNHMHPLGPLDAALPGARR